MLGTEARSESMAGRLAVVRGGPVVLLGPVLGEGGEGAVHELDGHTVAKVYRPDRLTPTTIAKLERMLATGAASPRLAWPTAIVEDGTGRAIGYTMPRAGGRSLQRSVFVPALLAQHFPRWTRLHLVDLAIAIVEAFAALHRHGVFVGDVNGGNVVVGEDPRGAMLVDLDSCQIGDFRAPMGTVPFVAPRLLGLELASVARTYADECFALATLLFMVLVPGKPPYSRKGGGDPTENIRAARFPYAADPHATDEVPDGPWRNVWTCLAPGVKTLFGRSFREHAVVGPAEWQRELELYRQLLLMGRTTLSIFPSAADASPVAMTLASCRMSAPGGGAAQAALSTQSFGGFPVQRVCEDCRGQFEIPDHVAWELVSDGRKFPRRCPACEAEVRDLRGAPSTWHPCKDCGATFELSAKEARYFARRGLQRPRRCVPCRRSRVRY